MTPSIFKDDVTHIARLARIHLTPKEVTKFTMELSAIVGYVQQLQDVDTRGVPSAAHATGATNVLRDDHVVTSSSDVRNELLHATPSYEGEQIKVKAVFQ